MERSAKMGLHDLRILRCLWQLALAWLLLLAACEDDGGCDEDAVSCEECPAVSDACAPACAVMTAIPYDVGRLCDLPSRVVGCRPPTAIRPADAPCVVRVSDGAIFLAESSAGFQQSGWRRCTDEENAMMTRHLPCP